MTKDSLTITDNRTGTSYEVPLFEGNIRAKDLKQIKQDPEDFGVMSYDPAFLNTASCQSRVTFIDGDKGILRYRGYPIEQLAERCTFPEVAYLLVFGELPDENQLRDWVSAITHHTMIPEYTKNGLEGFRHDAHPMGMLISSVAALSTVYPDAKNVMDPESRRLQIVRLIAKMPTLAAYAYRHSLGYPYIYPDNDLSYAENFLNMMWKMVEPKYVANPVLARALDILFILHADHEQNCSTNTMRAIGSAQTDPYLSVAGAASALAGPLHGRANEEVLHMLDEIGTKDRIPAFIKSIKEGHGKLMGFGTGSTRITIHARASSNGRRRKYLKSRAGIRSWTSRWSSKESRLKTNISFRAGSIRTSIFIPGSSIRRWVSSPKCSRCCSRSPAPPDGWRSGKN